MGMVVLFTDRALGDWRVFAAFDAPLVCEEKISSIVAPCSYWSDFAKETGTEDVMDILFGDEREVTLEISHLNAFTEAWDKKNDIPVQHHQVMEWFLYWMTNAIALFEDPIVIHY